MKKTILTIGIALSSILSFGQGINQRPERIDEGTSRYKYNSSLGEQSVYITKSSGQIIITGVTLDPVTEREYFVIDSNYIDSFSRCLAKARNEFVRLSLLPNNYESSVLLPISINLPVAFKQNGEMYRSSAKKVAFMYRKSVINGQVVFLLTILSGRIFDFRNKGVTSEGINIQFENVLQIDEFTQLINKQLLK